MSQRRNYFRIRFPVTQRPCLVVNSAHFEILELSETGAGVAAADVTMFDSSGEFEATILFRDGTMADVTARVHRQEADEIILRFPEGLPYSVVTAEQRRLMKLFPREAQTPRAV